MGPVIPVVTLPMCSQPTDKSMLTGKLVSHSHYAILIARQSPPFPNVPEANKECF